MRRFSCLRWISSNACSPASIYTKLLCKKWTCRWFSELVTPILHLSNNSSFSFGLNALSMHYAFCVTHTQLTPTSTTFRSAPFELTPEGILTLCLLFVFFNAPFFMCPSRNGTGVWNDSLAFDKSPQMQYTQNCSARNGHADAFQNLSLLEKWLSRLSSFQQFFIFLSFQCTTKKICDDFFFLNTFKSFNVHYKNSMYHGWIEKDRKAPAEGKKEQGAWPCGGEV